MLIYNTHAFKHLHKSSGWGCDRSGLWCHQYVDDTQPLHAIPSDPKEVVETLNCALDMVMGWMRTKILKLNPHKTEMQLTGSSSSSSRSVLRSGCTLMLDGAALALTTSVCTLWVLLFSSLLLDSQVAAMAKSIFCQLGRNGIKCPEMSGFGGILLMTKLTLPCGFSGKGSVFCSCLVTISS